MKYIIWTTGVIVINTIASFFSQKRAHTYIKQPYEPLPDLIHQYISPIPQKTPDFILLGLFVYCYLYTQLNYHALNTLLWSLSIRPIFLIATTFPACSKKQTNNTSLYSKVFLSTHDLMFSGHTCLFSFFGTLMHNNIVHYAFPITLIVSRQHYTIDVLCSLLVYEYFELKK